jgi:hypothetical protein
MVWTLNPFADVAWLSRSETRSIRCPNQWAIIARQACPHSVASA